MLTNFVQKTFPKVAHSGKRILRLASESKSNNDNNTLSQAYELEKEQISNILRKKKKRNVLLKTEVPDQGPELTVDEALLKSQEEKTKPVELKKNQVDVKSFENKVLAQKSLIDSIQNGLIPMPDEIKEFKYGLPIPNIDPEIKGIQEIADQLTVLPPSPTENLYELLKLDGESSYGEFEHALQTSYNFSKLSLQNGLLTPSRHGFIRRRKQC